MAVPDPDHLLEQADRLIASTGGGTPRQVDLRRAISNAYYALFHAVTTEAADDFVGRTHRHTPRYQLVYRSVEHKSLRRLCEDIVKSTLPPRYSDHEPAGSFGPDLQFFAAAVIDLQEKRHLADYDPLFRVTKSEALLDVERGRTALTRLRAASRIPRRAFLALILFSPR
jgi:hypothetical protein